MNDKLDCIICAKGNSKGIPNKNFKTFGKTTLIEIAIQKALSSRYINKIIVSTEHDKVIYLAKKAGATLVYKRDKKLSEDRIRQVDVVIELVNSLKNKFKFSEYCILLQTTTPFINVKDLNKSINIHLKNNKGQVLTTSSLNINPSDLYIQKNESLKKVYKSQIISNQRQLHPKLFVANGAVRIFKLEYLLEKGEFFNIDQKILNSIIPEDRSLNLDEMTDWNLAIKKLRKI